MKIMFKWLRLSYARLFRPSTIPWVSKLKTILFLKKIKLFFVHLFVYIHTYISLYKFFPVGLKIWLMCNIVELLNLNHVKRNITRIQFIQLIMSAYKYVSARQEFLVTVEFIYVQRRSCVNNNFFLIRVGKENKSKNEKKKKKGVLLPKSAGDWPE